MEYKYRKLEPGVTSATFDRSQKLCGLIGCTGVVIVFVLLWILRVTVDRTIIFVPLLVVGGLSAAAARFSNCGVPGSTIADDREAKAGYTTVWFKPGWADLKLDVDLVDARTGIVLCEAGQPQLTKEEYRSRLEAIRDEPDRVKERRR